MRAVVPLCVLWCFSASLPATAHADTPPLKLALPNSAWTPPPEWPRAESPYKISLLVDLPLIVVTGALWILPFAITTDELQGPFCGTPIPCDRNNVNAFDRLAIGNHSSGADIAANVILYTLPAFGLALKLTDYGPRNYKGYLSDFVVLAETLAISGFIDEIFRRAVHRPRPYLYEPVTVNPTDRTGAEASFSFYSGHTAAMFAYSIETALTFTFRHPHSVLRYPLWIGLLLASTAEGILRVYSGDHFPTDVITGAVIGSALGLLVPIIHRRTNPLSGITVLPSVHGDTASVSVVGRF